MRSILNTNVITGLGMCKVCTEAIRSSPLRSSVNTNVVTGLCMCEVCAESVNVQKKIQKTRPKTKTRPAKKGTKPRKVCVLRSANVPVCGYIYTYIYVWVYAHT